VRKLLNVIGLLSFATFAWQVQAAGTLKIGTECTYAPFTYRDADGTIKGFDIDIATEVAKRLGKEPEFICQPFDSSIPALRAKKFDVLFTAISVTDERLKSINFSVPYRSSIGRFIGNNDFNSELYDQAGKPNADALKSKVVGLQRSSTYEKYIKDNFPDAKIQRYDTVNNMVLDLRAKRVDVIVAGSIVLFNVIEKDGGDQFKTVGAEIDDPTYFGIGVAAGIRKNDTELKKDVDAALNAMFADGTFKAINQKYWQFSVLPSAWQ